MYVNVCKCSHVLCSVTFSPNFVRCASPSGFFDMHFLYFFSDCFLVTQKNVLFALFDTVKEELKVPHSYETLHKSRKKKLSASLKISSS